MIKWPFVRRTRLEQALRDHDAQVATTRRIRDKLKAAHEIDDEQRRNIIDLRERAMRERHQEARKIAELEEARDNAVSQLAQARGCISQLEARIDLMRNQEHGRSKYKSIIRASRGGKYRVGIIDGETGKGMWNQTGRGSLYYDDAAKLAATLPFELGLEVSE